MGTAYAPIRWADYLAGPLAELADVERDAALLPLSEGFGDAVEAVLRYVAELLQRAWLAVKEFFRRLGEFMRGRHAALGARPAHPAVVALTEAGARPTAAEIASRTGWNLSAPSVRAPVGAGAGLGRPAVEELSTDVSPRASAVAYRSPAERG